MTEEIAPPGATDNERKKETQLPRPTPGPWHVGGWITGGGVPARVGADPLFCGGKQWPYQTVSAKCDDMHRASDSDLPSGYPVAICPSLPQSGIFTDPEVGSEMANARLIAAAPDLLREAKNLLAAIELVSGTGAELDDEELNGMRAAIAKASAFSDPDHRPSAAGEAVSETPSADQSVSGDPHAK